MNADGRELPGRKIVWACLVLVVAVRAGAQTLPDLIMVDYATRLSARLDLVGARPGDCILTPPDTCVGSPGGRKVLRFGALMGNIGAGNLAIGVPNAADPRFEFSACHGHFHFKGFSLYELAPRGEPGAVVTGRKQAFCIRDSQQLVPGPAGPFFNCGFQGLQAGWGDLYDAALDCQWLDVTDLPPGDYDLRVTVNPDGLLPEADYGNNTAVVAVTIPAPTAVIPTVRLRRPRSRLRPYRVGEEVTVRWSRRLSGSARLQEVWFSRDDGAQWEFVELVTKNLTRHLRWIVPDGPPTVQARIKVIVWDQALQPGLGVSEPFSVGP